MITRSNLHIICATLILTRLLSNSSAAQNHSPNAYEQSYRRARRIVDEGYLRLAVRTRSEQLKLFRFWIATDTRLKK